LTEKCGGGASGSYHAKAVAWMPLLLLIIFTACSRQTAYPEAVRNGPDISIGLSSLQPGIPQYFSHALRGTKIHFFVVKMDDGVIAFLDACTKCYKQKKGFAYDSGFVICRACDERYPITEIEKGFGSCYPVKLEGRIAAGRYLISTAELEKIGSRYFQE
jgi:uncharacterized membrane protein